MLDRIRPQINFQDRGTRALLAILALSLFLNLYGINWGLPYPKPPSWGDVRSNFWWAHDTVAPVSPLAAAHAKFSWGAWSRDSLVTYPLFHYVFLGVAYAPYATYLVLTDQLHGAEAAGYPYGLANPETALSVFTLIARLVSALMATGIVVLTYLTGKALFERRAGLIAAAITTLCYTLVFYAHTSNLDVPYLFWSLLGIYAYVRAIDTHRPLYFALTGAGAALAIGTKDQAYGLFIALPLPLLWSHYRHRRRQARFDLKELLRSVLDRQPLAALGSALLAYAVSNNLFFNYQRFARHLNRLMTNHNNDQVLDSGSLAGHWELFAQTVYFIQRSLGTPLFVLCLLAALYTVVRHFKRAGLLVLPAATYYLTFVVVAFYVHSRFILPLVVLLAILAGKGLSQALATPHRFKGVAGAALAIVWAFALPYAFSLNLTLLNDARFEATHWIKAHVPPGAVIQVYNRPDALPHLLDDYQVQWISPEPSSLPVGTPEYVVVTERDYRSNANRPEAELRAALLQSASPLSDLLQGRRGYQVVAEFKYVPHSWLNPDIIYTINPRILILKRTSSSTGRWIGGIAR